MTFSCIPNNFKIPTKPFTLGLYYFLHIASPFTTEEIRNHCQIIKERGAPSTAILTRDLFHAVYKYAILKGHKIENPAENIANASIATFRPRERVLSPREIHIFSKN